MYMEADEWYLKRDDRTRRISNCVKPDYSVALDVDPRVTKSYALQCLTTLVCNSLARWCRNIVVNVPDCPADEALAPGEELVNYIRNNMSRADPHGCFAFGESNDDCSLSLYVGKPDSHTTDPLTWVDGCGWVAGFGISSHSDISFVPDKNPIGPAFAACMASAYCFARAHEQPFTMNTDAMYVSLFDYEIGNRGANLNNPHISDMLDTGTICQIGCGAVGSCFAHLLSISQLSGKIDFIDNDTVSYENCGGSWIFSPSDVKQPKVDVCRSTLQNGRLEAKAYKMRYDEFSSESRFDTYNPDIILCFANEHNVGSQIQNMLPCIVLHGATTENWTAVFGRHMPVQEWCISCALKHLENPRFEMKCGSGMIQSPKGNITVGMLPFLPPVAAVLTLSELMRLCMGKTIFDNNAQVLMKPPFNMTKKHRGETNGCMCIEQNSNVYNELRRDTKFYQYRIKK